MAYGPMDPTRSKYQQYVEMLSPEMQGMRGPRPAGPTSAPVPAAPAPAASPQGGGLGEALGGALRGVGKLAGNLQGVAARLPAAYAAGRGNLALANQMNQQRHQREMQVRMMRDLDGLDPTEPSHMQKILGVLTAYGDMNSVMQYLQMVQTGQLEQMKMMQQAVTEMNKAPKMETLYEGGERVNVLYIPNHPMADANGYVEVGRGTPTPQMMEALGQAKLNIFRQIAGETGDEQLALAYAENKAFRDPGLGILMHGDNKTRGEQRDFMGFSRSMERLIRSAERVRDEVQDTGIVKEWTERGMRFIGEGHPALQSFVQANTNALTQMVKAMSGAQVSDKEIERYKQMFLNMRDIARDGKFKPGAYDLMKQLSEIARDKYISRFPSSQYERAKVEYDRVFADAVVKRIEGIDSLPADIPPGSVLKGTHGPSGKPAYLAPDGNTYVSSED